MRKIQIIFISIISLICIIPVLTMPFFRSDISESQETGVRASFPEFEIGENGSISFFDEFNTYLDENFNFRDNLIGMNSYLMENVFHTSIQEDVIVGKEGWLYYGETVDDYTGESLLSEIDIERISHTIFLIEEYVEGQGAEFVFTIAPNKNSIYSDNMPDSYLEPSDDSNAQQLSQKLSDTSYVDLFEVLTTSEEITYLERDSHWNNYGAYLGFQEIMDSLGVEELNFEITGSEVLQEFDADLEGMLYPLYWSFDEQIYYDFNTEFTYTSKFKTVEDIIIETACETGEGRILVFRDSFGNSLLDYFARQFEEVEFSRAVPYTINQAEEVDYLVIELVERNIPNLLETAPIMPAPLRENSDLEEVEAAYIQVEEYGDYTHVYGYIEGLTYSDVEGIYIQVLGEEGIYETFLILEEEMVNILEDAENVVGFSAYIEKQDLKEDELQIKVEQRG